MAEPLPGVNTAISEQIQKAPWESRTDGLVVDEDDDPEVKEKIPEPVLVRAVLLALVGLAGAVAGKEFDVSWVDSAVTLYAVAAPLALGFWARRHVTPLPKK